MFKISEELANKIFQYLVAKPYGEVYQFVTELQKLEKIEEEAVVEEVVEVTDEV